MSARHPRPIRKKGAIAAALARRTVPKGQRLAFQVDPWTRRLARPILTALLASSVAIALLVVIQAASPAVNWLAIWPLALFAALEGAYTAAWLDLPESRGVERGAYRAAEILVLIVAARVYSWVVFGGGIPTPEEVQLFLATPLAFFMRGGFFITTLVVLLCWWMATTISRILVQLDVSPHELDFYTLSSAEQSAQGDNRPIQIPRSELQKQYLRLWLEIGVLMVLLAALSTFDVTEFVTVSNPFDFTRLGLPRAMLTALMIYFLTGLWLLSHTRLLRMNARWLIDGVALEPSLERGWQRNSLLLIAFVALGAAFLPIGSTLAIGQLVELVVAGVLFLVSLSFSLVAYVFAAILTTLTRNVDSLNAPQPEPLVLPPTAPNLEPAPPNPMFAFIISSAFWALLIALIVGAFIFVLRERGYRLELGRVQHTWSITKNWVAAMWLRLRRSVRAARRRLAGTLRSVTLPSSVHANDEAGSRRRFVHLSALSPRDQIRYLYLSTVRRAGERGIRRRVSETPLEYVHELKEGWPEGGGDWEELTSAFVVARYSPEPVDRQHVNYVRQHWKRVRALLRRSSHRS